MRKITFVLQTISALFIALIFNSNFAYSQCLSGTLEGSVYIDKNFDGVNNSDEIGSQGIYVRVYDTDGLLIGQSVSGSNGHFNVQGLNDGDEYRVEYDIGSNNYVSSIGINNKTEVQFVTIPYCNSELAIIDSQTDCNTGSEIFLTCFVNGLGSNPPTQETVIGLNHNFNASSGVTAYANQSETGSVWAIAFKNSTEEIFTASYIKQHAALTAHGHDAIFSTNVSGNTGVTNLFAKLSNLGQEVGTLSEENSTVCEYGKQVGKIGLGAMVIDETEENLYIANLYNNSVVRIKTDNPTQANTESFPVPNPSCSFNDFRIFALTIFNKDLYVGVTCTGETSKNTSDLSFHVYKMNMNSGNYNLIFTADEGDNVWDSTDLNKSSTLWLKDIVFTDAHHMVLGIGDKVGDTYCNGATSRVDDQYGDILMVYNNNNGWHLESNGQTPTRTGSGVGNGEGPGEGEFFGDDFFPKDPSDHSEVTLGALFALPNPNEVIATVYDPLFNTYSGGLHRYSALNGQKLASKELYNHNIMDYFGKATGFGDITARCGILPVEIGNLVWIDDNNNGEQDAGESPLSNHTIIICDDKCVEIGSTTTDSNGNYSFNNDNVDRDLDGQMDGLVPGEQYYISLDPTLFDHNSLSYVINNSYYYPTVITSDPKINSNLSADLNPCESVNSKNIPMVAVSAVAGNNTTFDLGLNASNDFDLALMKTLTSSPSVRIGDNVSFDIEVYNQGGLVSSEYEIVDYLTPAFEFDSSINPGWILNDNKLKKKVISSMLPGTSHTESITLKVTSSNQIEDYINVAEISYAKDHEGKFGVDIDSTPDDTMENDKGGEVNTLTDNIITDDGTLDEDEDDHDPAQVKILDLALMNIIRDDRNYDLDETVVFDMTVYNQGNVATTSFSIINEFPESLEFKGFENPSWTKTTGSTVVTTYNSVLEPGESASFELTFRLVDNNDFRNIVNFAEISSFTSADPNILNDFDSTPDILLNNDNGGNPYDITDNMIDDHGTLDEDDHDPAFIRVRMIDLALMKSALSKVQKPGENADFEISIVNQGDITVKSVTLVDYLPEHTTLVDNTWTADSSDPTGRTVYKAIDFIGGFLPGNIYKETITINVDGDVSPGLIINEAEIAQVLDFNGKDISALDIDSKADMKYDNDTGGGINTDKDDFLDGNGIDDEDDHDPAALYVAAIEIQGACYCLDNASNQFDGQFYDTIVVTAPSGQTWNIDYTVHIYDPVSLAPPAIPTPFTTGTLGYTLSEFPLGDGTSEYQLIGLIVDNTPYSIRVFNEDSAFLQISGGGTACAYDDVVILSPTDGLSAVCSNSYHTYEVGNTYGCNSYTWSVSGLGATIIGPNNLNTVEVYWTVSGGPYELSLQSNCPGACLSPITTYVNVGIGDGAMACRQDINVSLGLDCTTEVTPSLILTNPQGGDVVYQVMVTDKYGQLIPNNLLTENHLWTDVIAKVIDPCNANSCWSTITVEDKMPPVIQCGDIELPCWQMDSYEPIVYDNCTDATFTLISETIDPIPCHDDYIKIVERVYVAHDEHGNQSDECTQTISLERIDMTQIIWPEHFMLLDFTNLSCSDSLYDENGYPRVEITGVPTLHGGLLYPFPDVYCNVGVDYSDFLVTEFGCVKKIMRTWTVYEAWCTVGVVEQFTQTIEIVDTFNPDVTCPDDFEVSSDGGLGCTASEILALPIITDDCSTEFEIDISYPGGFIDNATKDTVVTLDAGVSEIIYTVYDGCENSSTCAMYITVIDESAPTAVCDQNTIVSLRSDGTAKAFAHTFDDGSYDDCSLFKMLVRRMGTTCDCKVPVYDNMRYLGERYGRYYYLSTFKTHGFKAFAYSEAFGGFLVTLESEEEQDWVYEHVNDVISGNYYIGMSDEQHQGTFTWSNHAEPTYNNWFLGLPNNIGDNVVTNANGYWEVVNGGSTEAYFVMEVSDPCTFSNEVHFCCDDVADEQMVIFRAIDYFGKYNDCMMNVEVQDKVPPNITCPPDLSIDCTTIYDLEDLSIYGQATASDVCMVTLTETASDTINVCKVGTITRTFVAADLNGYSTCDQIIHVVNNHPFDPLSIIWPLDYESQLGCNSGDLHPDNLPFENGYPQFIVDECDLVGPTFKDQTFSFAGDPDSSACLKILRTWTIIDWCEMENNPFYLPEVYEQTIKVINTMGPTIVSGCDTLIVNTEDCDKEAVMFTIVASDDCTPTSMIDATLEVDEFGNGSFDFTEDIFSNTLSFNDSLAVGEHFALASFEDMCGNKTTCAKIIHVVNVKSPTAACIEGLAVALVPMDLDDDGTPDTEMTCVFPEMIDASSTHVCGFEINLSFSADTADDKTIYDCQDLGIQIIELWVTDEFGNTDKCVTTVEVQDNNMVDFCPRFDLALVKTLDTGATPGPFRQGDDITYDIEIINQGNIGAYRIELVDYIPDGLTLNDSDWTDNAGIASLNTPIAFLEDSTSTNVGITFTIDSDFMGFTITNVAEISYADDDSDPMNDLLEDSDSDPDETNDDVIGGDDITDNTNGDEDDHDPELIDVIQEFDLSLLKDVVGAGPFVPGGSVTFDITVTNEGTLDATTVYVADNIPTGLNLDDSDWTENAGVATINTPIASIPVGTSETVSITFEIDLDFMEGDITNSAEIVDPDDSDFDDIDSDPDRTFNDDDKDDGNPDDDEDEEMITVTHVFDLALTKIIDAIATPSSYHPGDDVTFIITVYNQGSLDATDVVVEDYVPAGMTFNNADNGDFTEGGGDYTATILTVAARSEETISLTLQIDSDYSGSTLVNNAEIIDATNTMGLTDQDDDLSITNDGSSNELGTDDDIDDEADMTPGTMDNPNDEDDYDPALIDVDCDLAPHCGATNTVVMLDANGDGSIVAADIDNNSFAICDEATGVMLSIDKSTFDCSELGSGNIVTLTVTDDLGNSATCQADVTVVDNISPTVSCTDVITTLDMMGNPILVIATVTMGSEDDNCFVDTVEFDLSSLDLNTLPCTPQNATVVVTDQSGNTGTCTFLITIVNSPPEAVCNPGFVVQLNSDGEATVAAANVDDGSTDDCTLPNDLMFSLDQSMFDCDDIGMVTVTLTVTDETGLTDQCTSELTIEDNIPPVAICQDITIELNSNGVRNITTLLIDNGSNDNCTDPADLGLSLDITQFLCSDVALVNTVVLTVTDDEGNTGTCAADVVVQDNTPPVVTCQPDFTVSLNANGGATITVGQIIASSSDACGIDTEEIDDTHVNCGDIGDVIITATVTDVNGNSATCTTTVTVEDNLDPDCTLLNNVVIPPNQPIQLSDIFDTFSDNCSNASANTIIDPADGFDCDSLGMRVVTVTVTDDSGNTSTCTTIVTVEDVSAPICQTMDITVALDNNGDASIVAGDVDDNSTAGCAGIDELTVDPSFFACNDVGDNVVTLTVLSNNGMSTECDATVTIVDDIPPVANCIANLTVDLDASGNANITTSEIITNSSDGCGIMSEVLDISSFDCSDKGSAITVTATVTDMNGNSTTCSSQVTIEDNLAPECTLLPNLEFIPDVTISIDDVLDTFTDNCATGTSMITTQTEFTCNDLGTHLVEVMVTDTCGNDNTCTTMIDIVDDSTPSCITMDITVSLDANGEYDLDPIEVDDGSSAACGGTVTLEVDPDMFDCTDLGDVVVTLSVTSSGGGTSECTATVTIEDNAPPTIVCPADMTLACDADLTDLNQYGIATTNDNCDNNVSLIVDNVIDVNACSVGTVTRTFTATDNEGNSVSCTQVITIDEPVNPVTESDITWPMSPFDAGDCIADPDNIDSGMPVVNLNNADCALISIDFVDVDPTPGSSGCNDTFERTWTVVDSCQLNGGSSGIFTFLQIINLNDSVGPIIDGPMDTIIYLDPMSATCDTFINLPATISDCVGGFSATNDSPYADDNATEDASGTYPAGETEVTITAIDTCGNESTYTYLVNVVDSTAAIFSCEKIIGTIDINMMEIITVDQAQVMLTTACSDTIYNLSFSNITPDSDTIIADCTFVGITNYTVYLWNGTVLLDSCTNLLQILDGGGFCTSPLSGSIVGATYTEDHRMVDDVMVNLEGSPFNFIMTEDDGEYAFPPMPFGGSYEVVPGKDIDPLNGVSTLDLIEIQRHILGISRLDSPYKYIAADIDKSGDITTFDLLELRRMILGHYPEFPNNTSWRMVDAAYNFVDPDNPFLNDIPEDYEIFSFNESMEINFIGVKTGNVNNSANANSTDGQLENRSSETFEFVIDDEKMARGQEIEVVFGAENLHSVDGYQLTIKIDPAKAQIVSFEPIDPSINMNNVNLKQIREGLIHMSWNKLSLYDEELLNLFSISVKSTSNDWLSEITSISETFVRPEAYYMDDIQEIDLDFRIDNLLDENIILYQNQPNPWLETTNVKYYSPTEGDVRLNVYDINGRTIYSTHHNSSIGINKIELRKSDVQSATGILYYELISGDTRLMEKMLLLK